MDLHCGLPSEIDVNQVKPAKYNPRVISDPQFEVLCESIKTHGIVIPIIVNGKNNTIIAGHQRSKACAKAGISNIPCIITGNITDGDEIKFNQLHNGTFTSTARAAIRLDGKGYSVVSPATFGEFDCSAAMVKEACGLMLKYGNVFSAVVVGGEVVYGAEYIRACQLLNAGQCLVYISQDSRLADSIRGEYGRYSYEHLEKKTYVQGLAQLYRSAEAKEGKKQYASTLYSKHVIPQIKPGMRILDFGCGKGAYVDYVNTMGARAFGIEFYPNNGSEILVGKAHKNIERVLKDISANGLFDVVVCDSVLNSVDSKEAEKSVVLTCAALTKGKVYISGRPLDAAIQHMKSKRDKFVSKRFVEFLDADGFTATYRKGQWYYQHYHSKQQVADLMESAGLKIERLDWKTNGDSWQAECKKIKQLPADVYREAIAFEFSLPLPNGKRYELSQMALDAIEPHLDAC